MNNLEFAAWRKRFRLSQEDLAVRWAGVTRTTIQNWESGATPIPQAVESACAVWERRLKQEDASLGPVTLIYADGPMFIEPYGPRRRLAQMQQEPYRTNTSAIARVISLWGRNDFHNPFIIEKSGEDLWNVIELARVVAGRDGVAPTIPNLLRRLAKHIRETSSLYVRSGPRLLSADEDKGQRSAIEAVAQKIDELATTATKEPVAYRQVEGALEELRELGKLAPDKLVFSLAEAFTTNG